MFLREEISFLFPPVPTLNVDCYLVVANNSTFAPWSSAVSTQMIKDIFHNQHICWWKHYQRYNRPWRWRPLPNHCWSKSNFTLESCLQKQHFINIKITVNNSKQKNTMLTTTKNQKNKGKTSKQTKLDLKRVSSTKRGQLYRFCRRSNKWHKWKTLFASKSDSVRKFYSN